MGDTDGKTKFVLYGEDVAKLLFRLGTNGNLTACRWELPIEDVDEFRIDIQFTVPRKLLLKGKHNETGTHSVFVPDTVECSIKPVAIGKDFLGQTEYVMRPIITKGK